jgi:hypothetical protein
VRTFVKTLEHSKMEAEAEAEAASTENEANEAKQGSSPSSKKENDENGQLELRLLAPLVSGLSTAEECEAILLRYMQTTANSGLITGSLRGSPEKAAAEKDKEKDKGKGKDKDAAAAALKALEKEAPIEIARIMARFGQARSPPISRTRLLLFLHRMQVKHTADQ